LTPPEYEYSDAVGKEAVRILNAIHAGKINNEGTKKQSRMKMC